MAEISERKYKIYTLNEPCSNIIRYVGLTGQTIKQRFYDHYKCTVKTHKADWIRSVKKRGLRPKIRIIESGLTLDEAKKQEIYYISKYKELGYDLTNGTNGGDGMFNPSAEVREKMGNAHRGKKLSAQQIEGIRKRNTGLKRTPEQKKRMSEGSKGKIIPPETRKKISESRKGIVFSEAHLQKMRENAEKRKGRKISEERRLKMIGKKRNHVSKCKASNTMKEHFNKMSPEKRALVNQHQRKFTNEQLIILLEEKKKGLSYPALSKKYNVCPATMFLNIKIAKKLYEFVGGY